jgi:hypothetical protein
MHNVPSFDNIRSTGTKKNRTVRNLYIGSSNALESFLCITYLFETKRSTALATKLADSRLLGRGSCRHVSCRRLRSCIRSSRRVGRPRRRRRVRWRQVRRGNGRTAPKLVVKGAGIPLQNGATCFFNGFGMQGRVVTSLTFALGATRRAQGKTLTIQFQATVAVE